MPGIVKEISTCVAIDSVKGADIFVSFDNGDILTVNVGDGKTVCEMNFVKGDRAKLIASADNIREIKRIQPFRAPCRFDGQITHSDHRKFALVDGRIVIFDEYAVESLKIGDKVIGLYIEGDYYQKNDYYLKRVIEIQPKIEPLSPNSHSMRFKNAIPYTDSQYDIPSGLYEIITSNKITSILDCLNELFPNNKELTMENLCENHHRLLYLEEIEMKRTFELYKNENCRFSKEKKKFSLFCTDIEDLRPPISRGDQIIAIKMKDMDKYSRWIREERYYRGIVDKVYHDRYIISFISDRFKNDWNDSQEYYVEFQYNRTIYKRKHEGVDAALLKFDEQMFFPTELVAKPPQIDVRIEDGKFLLNTDGKSVDIPWFNQHLNDEQKKSVMLCLRGESRPLPFIIYGPPGTGKTATLVETVLQVFTHLPESRILIATQSNSAANVVTTRLLSIKSKIAFIEKAILRLISNATLDKKKIPENLYTICASLSLNTHNDDVNDASEIKRTLSVELLRKHRIVLSTCGGIGAVIDKGVSFSHVFIDEASQCHEPEALVPISMVDPVNGQIILAGDPLQLSPIVLSNHAKDRGLCYSMLERYFDRYGNIKTTEMKNGDVFDPRLVCQLTKNYRALPSILKFYSDRFYQSQLEATINKDNKEMKYLEHTYRMSFAGEKVFGIRFYNVNGENKRQNGRRSWHNPSEAEMLVKLMERLIYESKVKGSDIGIITPYYAQVLCLRRHLEKSKISEEVDIQSIRIGTVEEFQGEEKRIIAFSAVKTSGGERALRFVHCAKRLNTAISRGRDLVIIFGNVKALSVDANWSALIDYCKTNGSFVEDNTHGDILNRDDD